MFFGRRLVERYLKGELSPEGDAALASGCEETGSAAPRFSLDPCQLRLKALVDKNVQRSIEARDAEDDDTYEATVRAAEGSKILAALGPPGSGKTAAIHTCIDDWKRQGAPAGQRGRGRAGRPVRQQHE